MYKKIKLNELTQKELKSVEEYKKQYNINDPFVYYVTDFYLGMGYQIIISCHMPKKINNELNFGEFAMDITDYDERLDTF